MKIRFIIALLCFTLLTVNVSAEDESINIQYNAINKNITISAELPVEAGSSVTVNVIDSGTSISETNLPYVSRMFFAPSSGKINIEIPLADNFPMGKYTVLVGYDGKSVAYADDVLVFDEAEASDIVYEANSKTTSDLYADYIIENSAKLGIDKNLVNDIESVCEIVYNIKSVEGDFDYREFNRAFRQASLSQIVQEKSTEYVFSVYSDVFNTEYNVYSQLSESLKNDIGDVIRNIELKEKFVEFEDLLKISELRVFDNRDDFEDYLLNNSSYFSIDTSGSYKDLSVNSKSMVFATMFDKRDSFYNADDVADAFSDTLESFVSSSENASSSGGGGNRGGGGSAGGSFSLATPAIDVEAPVTDNSENDKAIYYSDIESHFAKDAILNLSQKEIINGFEDSSFRPDEQVTRAQLAKMVSTAFGIKANTASVEFADVGSDDWFFDSVNALSSNGIVVGDGIRFRPSDFVTREDAAVILFKTLKKIGIEYTGSYTFKDGDSISDYAKESVSALAANQVILGDESGFRPRSGLTRGEAAILIYRLLEKV